MQHKTNLAYDLERFENRELVITKVSSGAKKTLKPFKVVAIAILFIAIISTMLYSRVMITELNMQVNAATAQLDELRSEGVRMETELEGKISLKKIEEVAVGEYGMVKPDSSQVGYIQLNSENKIESASKQESVLSKAVDFFKNLF